jgi:hypothetical protein
LRHLSGQHVAADDVRSGLLADFEQDRVERREIPVDVVKRRNSHHYFSSLAFLTDAAAVSHALRSPVA